jgi:hypothetical protein
MADYVDVEGKIEGLGNAQVAKFGTFYSVVKFRTSEGKAVTLSDVALGPRCNIEFQLGSYVRLLGKMVDGKVLVFAIRSDDEVADDVAEIVKGRGSMVRLGWLLILLSVVTFWTIIAPIVLLPHAFRTLRTAWAAPTETSAKRA